jgi:hypothetical protein
LCPPGSQSISAITERGKPVAYSAASGDSVSFVAGAGKVYAVSFKGR